MKRIISLLFGLALIAAACADDDTLGVGTAATSEPTAAPGTTAVPDPTEAPTEEPAAVAPLPPTTVSLTTPDGLTLDATVYAAGPEWVVLAHMFPADKTSWEELASLFQESGYSVLAYNNRGYGASEGEKEPFELLVDAQTAIEYARTEGGSGIVFGAASMNGAAAMTLGAGTDFDAIFLLSGVPSFPSAPDGLTFLPEVDEPILFVAARDDGSAVRDARNYFDLAIDPDLFVLEAGGHGTRMLEADPDLGDRIVEWVKGVVDA